MRATHRRLLLPLNEGAAYGTEPEAWMLKVARRATGRRFRGRSVTSAKSLEGVQPEILARTLNATPPGLGGGN